MCLLCFLAKWRGITVCLRSQAPVSSFHVPRGRISPNSAYRRWLTSSFCSGVQLQRCKVGRFVLDIGIKACPLPTDLAFVIVLGSGRLGSFFPVKRSLPLCTLLLCLAIFFLTPLFSNTLRLFLQPFGQQLRTQINKCQIASSTSYFYTPNYLNSTKDFPSGRYNIHLLIRMKGLC